MDASTSPTGVYPELKVHIDGEWIGRGNRRTHRVLNPATGQTLAELPLVDADDLDRALSAAEPRPTWGMPWARARMTVVSRWLRMVLTAGSVISSAGT